MEIEIITIFCICNDYLNAIEYKDDSQSKMSTAEVMTVALVASKYFGGNYEKSRKFLSGHNYIKNMLSKSQFNRRLRSIDSIVWQNLFYLISKVFKQTNIDNEYIIDTFPVPVCHNIRISRCKIYNEKQYRGYSASKKQYFFGLKVAIIATNNKQPVEFIFFPGSFHDSTISKHLNFDLPEGSKVYGDSAFSDEWFESILKDSCKIQPMFDKKTNSKKPHSLWDEYLIKKNRKSIETTISSITNLFPKKIHSVTAFGFELKIFCFILVYAISFL